MMVLYKVTAFLFAIALAVTLAASALLGKYGNLVTVEEVTRIIEERVSVLSVISPESMAVTLGGNVHTNSASNNQSVSPTTVESESTSSEDNDEKDFDQENEEEDDD